MKSFLLIALIFGACQSTGVNVETAHSIPPVASTEVPSTSSTTTIVDLASPSTDTAPTPLAPRSIHPYQSDVSIAQAVASPSQPDGYDWGLDYVQWVMGWDDAVAFDGLDGTDSWANWYRSASGEVLVSMMIVAWRPDGSTVEAVTEASTFPDDSQFNIEIVEQPTGWSTQIDAPTIPGAVSEVTVQFESASFETTLVEGHATIALPAEPHTWGSVQIAYRDASGTIVGWYATSIDH